MSDETERRGRSGAYLVLTALALLAAVYLILQILGVIFKVLFLAAVVVTIAASTLLVRLGHSRPANRLAR